MTSQLAGSPDHDLDSPYRWRALVVLLGLAVLSFLDRQILALMVGPIRHDLAISDFQIGLLQGLAFGLFYAVFGLPLGWLADHFARRWVIWGGVIIWSLATIASGLARSFDHLFLARLFVGAGEAALTPAAYSLISDLFPKRQLAFALSIFATGATVGNALAFALGGILVDVVQNAAVHVPFVGLLADWQLVFVILGLPGLVIAFLIFAIPEPLRRTSPKGRIDPQDFMFFLKSRRRLFSCSFVGFGCMSMVGYGLLAWMPAYLSRRFGMDVSAIGFTLAGMTTVAGIAGGMLSGRMVDKLFARGMHDAHVRYWVFAALLCAVLGPLALLAPSFWMFCLWMFPMQMLLPFSGVAAAMVQIATPVRLRGRTSALFILTFNLMGLGAGALFVSVLTDFVFDDDKLVGWSMALACAILCPIAAGLFRLSWSPLRSAAAG